MVIFILAIIIIGGYFLVKDTFKDFKTTGDSIEALVKTYGEADTYYPHSSGAIAAERIEAFISVRQSIASQREQIGESLQSISETLRQGNENESAVSVFGIIRRGVKLIPLLTDYLTIRNVKLLEVEMGIGEYYYLYIISYYAWLKKSPGDGPRFRLMGTVEDVEEVGGVNLTFGDTEKAAQSWYGDDVIAERTVRITRYARRIVLPILKNQLHAIDTLGNTERRNAFRRDLENEIEALEEDQNRLPWEDGLPREIRNSLDPFKSLLQESYNAMLNPFELIPER